MSGAQTSTFPTMNELLAPMAAYDTHANALLQQQQRTQEISDHDIAMTGQAAAPLLNLNEDQAAAAYPGWLQDMQSRGLAKYAPATYPGHAATAALVQRAMPILEQIQTGFLTTPGSADATKRINDIYAGGGTTPTAPASSGAPATGGDGLTGDKAHDLPLIAQRESGGSPTALNYVAREDPTAYARGATASGKYQIVNTTWREGMQLAGLDPAQYATARDAPEQVQDKVASAIYDKYGAKPWQKGPQDWVKDEQGRYQMATVRPPVGSPGGVPSTPPQGAAPGGPATPASYRVASNAPVPPPVSTAPIPTAGSPGAPAPAGLKYNMNSQGAPAGTILGYLPNGTAVLAGPTDTHVGITGWNADGTPLRGGAPASVPQPQAQAVPQPPANRAMPGGADGPPAPPPAAQQPPAPATRANLPRAADVPQGANSPQIQQAQRLRQAAAQIEVEAARNPYDKRLQAEAAAKAADLKQRADFLMQTDTVVQTQEGQLHPLTGKIDDPTKPIPHYVYDPTQHAYIDTTGTNKPEFEPAQRDSAVAQRDVMELGPKVANGTATQQEQARYATAVETYRQSKIITDPITKGLIRVNERELPAGFPEPPGLGGGGRPGGVSAASGPQTITPGMSPAQQEVEKKLGENFADQDTKAYAGANNSLYALGQMNNASEILDKQGGSAWTATGPAANLRIATAQGVNTLGSLFGVAPTFDPAAIGSWEALNKQTKLMGFKIINAAFGASREAASVINNATSAVPSAENTYLGFRLVSSGIEQELQRERELYEFKADRVRGGQPLATAEADFNKTHPIDVYTSRAIANAVPDDIAGYLMAHPDTVKAFDGHFGPGTGEFILKGGRTGLGQAARGR